MQRVIEPFNHVNVYDAAGYENPRVQETRCGSMPGIVTRVYLSQRSTDLNGESKQICEITSSKKVEFDLLSSTLFEYLRIVYIFSEKKQILIDCTT